MPVLLLSPPTAVSFVRQSKKPKMCPRSPPLPATVRHGGSSGRGAITPTASLPTTLELARRSRAACRAPPQLASSKSSALPTRLQQKSYHMYKTKSFSYCNLFFPTPEAFVSKQDASLWGERQWCGSAHAAEARWKWRNSWVVALFPPALPLGFIILVQWHLFCSKCPISYTAHLFYKETSKLKLYVRQKCFGLKTQITHIRLSAFTRFTFSDNQQ